MWNLRRAYAFLRSQSYLMQNGQGNVLEVRATRITIENGVLILWNGRAISAAYQQGRWATVVRVGCSVNDWHAQTKTVEQRPEPPPPPSKRTRGATE